MKKEEQIEWCVVKLGADRRWWIEETSATALISDDEQACVLDPKQIESIFDLLEPLQPYGLQRSLIEKAFLPLTIDRDLGQGRLRLLPTDESLSLSDGKLFALPRLFDESYGGYAEFIDHIGNLRVKMLNANRRLKRQLSIDDLEDQVRAIWENAENSGQPLHLFQEIVAILEFCPAGDEKDFEDEWEEWDASEEEQLLRDQKAF